MILLSPINLARIDGSIAGYGRVGPLAKRGGFDLILQAAMQPTHWLAANYFSTGTVIGGGNPKAWRNNCGVLGRPEWQDAPRFDHPQRRVKNRADLEALIEAELGRATVARWCERFDAAGVAAAPRGSPRLTNREI